VYGTGRVRSTLQSRRQKHLAVGISPLALTLLTGHTEPYVPALGSVQRRTDALPQKVSELMPYPRLAPTAQKVSAIELTPRSQVLPPLRGSVN